MKMPRYLLALLLVSAPVGVFAGPEVVPLWANGAPGYENRRDEPELAQDYWVKHINNPSVTVFLPPKEKATGAAVIIFPGGGHRELVFNAEGVDPAVYFNSIGVAAFAVKYRLGKETGSPYRTEIHTKADGQRAVRLVRSRAAEWGIDPYRIGVMGFSAGGEVAAMVVFSPTDGNPQAADPIDRVSCRPDFQIVVYPGGGAAPPVVPPRTPPALFIVANDDEYKLAAVVLDLVLKYRAAGVPMEAHIYERGGHAFNMGHRSGLKTLQHWPDRIADWMADNSILDPDPAHRAAK